MQIVFLNTFERKTESGGVISAQVTICEKQGVWAVLWMETGMPEGSPETWFEGTSWEEMLAAFRHGVAGRMSAGFVPVVDGMLEERTAGASFVGMLQCYGELHADKELFEALREWRRAKAAALKKSAYLLATNRMLWMISAFVPQTKEELLQLPGWGESKHNAYGQDILEITAKADRKSGFPLDWVADKLEPGVYTQWLYKQKEAKYKNEMERQQEKKRILSFVRQGGTLDSLHAELEVPRRNMMDRIEQLELEGYDLETLIDEELSNVPESEQQRVLDAFREMGDRYLKPVLHQVYGEKPEQDKPIELLYERLRLLRIRFRRSAKDQAV